MIRSLKLLRSEGEHHVMLYQYSFVSDDEFGDDDMDKDEEDMDDDDEEKDDVDMEMDMGDGDDGGEW